MTIREVGRPEYHEPCGARFTRHIDPVEDGSLHSYWKRCDPGEQETFVHRKEACPKCGGFLTYSSFVGLVEYTRGAKTQPML